MISKHILSVLVGTALMTGVAVAQTQTPAPAPAATPSASSDSSSKSTTAQGQWRASKMIGLDVYNDKDEKLGDVSELLFDQGGKVTAVIVGVGGFLGMGERNISISMDKLKFVNEPIRTSSTAPATGAGGVGSPTATRPAPGGMATGTGSSTTGAAPAATTSSPRAEANKWYPDHAVLAGATKESVKEMPEFKY